MVLFDYRVLGTEVWEGIIRRTRAHVAGVSVVENGGVERENGKEDEEWKKYFCGRLEIGIVVAEGGEDGKEGGGVQYNAYGEMIWD